MDDLLREELLQRAERDQQARSVAERDPGPMAAVDAENLPWLKQLVAERGWPSRSLVGEEASRAAWLLVQHADRDPVLQRQCLNLLAAAVAAGEARPQELAYLTDRVNLAEGRQQVYGTQVTARDGRWVPRPLADPARVNERRAAVGLEALEEYLTQFGEPPRPNNFPCPACAASIQFWTPELGEHLELSCAECGKTTTLSIGPG